MAMHVRYGITLGGDVFTGPAIVDKSNVSKLVDANKAGVR
jgi:hypothetical protein